MINSQVDRADIVAVNFKNPLSFVTRQWGKFLSMWGISVYCLVKMRLIFTPFTALGIKLNAANQRTLIVLLLLFLLVVFIYFCVRVFKDFLCKASKIKSAPILKNTTVFNRGNTLSSKVVQKLGKGSKGQKKIKFDMVYLKILLEIIIPVSATVVCIMAGINRIF